MSPIAEKQINTVDEAIEHLISRAENARGLSGEDVSVRVRAALDKYLLRDSPDAANKEIKEFIDEIRADDLCLIIACERGDVAGRPVANFDATVKSAACDPSNNEDAEDPQLYLGRAYGCGRTPTAIKSKLAYYSGRGFFAGWLRGVSQLAVTFETVEICPDRGRPRV